MLFDFLALHRGRIRQGLIIAHLINAAYRLEGIPPAGIYGRHIARSARLGGGP